MCGRFVSTTGPADLAAHFGAETVVGDLPQRWNVAPTSRVWVVRDSGATRLVEPMRWGLVPPWADDPSVGNRMFNARSETVTQRPAYRAAARRRRCIVPADGFYEWAPSSGRSRKQAWYFHGADAEPLAMAGLWETWQSSPSGDDVVHTCTVVTTAADDVVAAVHNRMPVVLHTRSIDAWLDSGITDPSEVSALLSANLPPVLLAHAVGSEVNNARNDGPALIVPVEPGGLNTGGHDTGAERRLL